MERACLALAAGALLALPAPAVAATTFHVVNDRDIPQLSGCKIDGSNCPGNGGTDFFGNVTLNVNPGQEVSFSRHTGDPCGVPEGLEGVTYVVEDPAPAEHTVVLPHTTGPSYLPANSDIERGLIGRLNQRREQNGKPQFRISTALNLAADAVAHDLAVQAAGSGSYVYPPPFCFAIPNDWGFPNVSSVASVDAPGTDPNFALEHWTDGSPRETLGTLGNWNSVGIGDGGGAYIVFFSTCASTFERCGLTDDFGDPAIPLPVPSGPGGGGGPGGGAPGGGGGSGGGAGGAAIGEVTVAASQTGGTVAATVFVGISGSQVALDLLSPKAQLVVSKAKRVSAGHSVKRNVTRGKRKLFVKLNRKARKALKAKGKLKLRLRISVTPPGGAAAAVTRKVKVKPK